MTLINNESSFFQVYWDCNAQHYLVYRGDNFVCERFSLNAVKSYL